MHLPSLFSFRPHSRCAHCVLAGPICLLCTALVSTFYVESVQAEAPAASDEIGSIAGRITDAAGHALAGVRVTLYRLHQPASPRWGKWRPAGPPLTTDQEGEYEFDSLSEGVYMPAASKDGFAPRYCPQRYVKNEPLEMNVVLKPPADPIIHVTDEAGRPVAGARVRGYELSAPSGASHLSQLSLRSLGLKIAPSDDTGRLYLPPMPAGERLTVTIDHPQLAPVRLAELTVGSGVVGEAVMKRGVTLTLRAVADDPAHPIDSAVIDLRFDPFDHPSTIAPYEIDFDAGGMAQLTIQPGSYHFLLLQHADFFLTPVLPVGTQESFRIEQGRNDDLRFDVRPKVPVHGRVVDAETGKLVRDVDLMGEIDSGAPETSPTDRWSFAEWATENTDGRYSINLAAGPARIGFFGAKSGAADPTVLDAESLYTEFIVAADGSTVIPDIRVRRLPNFTGVVRNPDGSPAVRAIVRFAGKFQPVLTDEDGRFKIQPNWIPIDADTGGRQYDQCLIALDPYLPLAARREVRLDKPEELVLTLERHPIDWSLDELDRPSANSTGPALTGKGVAPYASVSLRGRPAPLLEGVAWINTDEKPLSLANLRGKYVLLDFWMIPCLPCHADFPSVQMVHDLYKDRGVVVIGVHNSNYRTVEQVREHVNQLGISFPIVVDHLDGRTVGSYERHRIAKGYPSYVLIGPDGNVLLDDSTIAYPRSLHGYKLEIIRKFLLASQPADSRDGK
jgi:thiol-disulfide isomerase/thioredoxin